MESNVLVILALGVVILLWKIHLLRIKIWALTQQRDQARTTVSDLTIALKLRSDLKAEEPIHVERLKQDDVFRKSKRADRMKRSAKADRLDVRTVYLASM